ncbi:C40 family peptidase [Agromyces aerolatus]|uniref:C40 family peptidase n=1 Tax=Agromyces sp. LY-1074 TaxID=3074080 RepID=UPI0028667550|nr:MULTISPECIES: NlpC/P60 family protein [unclassified Agromyces]MDR5699982.1 NlpC/P60 family protein [Agromyces sp. LY-1074]MDR5706206.1 NlpC/P60 family protein [Agromyces sp. LY-1358]
MLTTLSAVALLALSATAPPEAGDPPTTLVTIPITVPAWQDGGYVYLPDTTCPADVAPYLVNTSFKDPEYLESGLANGVSFSSDTASGGVYLEVTSSDDEGYATGLAQGEGMYKNYLTNYSDAPWTLEATLHCTPSAADGYQPAFSVGSQSPEDAVEVARSMLGTPYVYGGSTPAGFDGPGLVKFSFAHAGVLLPHSIAGQDREGHRVSAEEARPGDLVVADTLREIGIFIGDGQMIAVFDEPGASVSIVPVFSGAHHFTRLIDAPAAG